MRIGPPGRGAVAGRGLRAAGLSGRQAAEPSRAVDRGAVGLWAAGLLLAKPVERSYSRDKNSQSTAIFGTQANLYGV